MANLENVKKFYELIIKDEDLKGKFKEINEKYDYKNISDEEKEKIVNKEIIPLAQKLGLEFTVEDIKEYEQNLSDDALSDVVGGATGICVGVGVGTSVTKGCKKELGLGFNVCVLAGVGAGFTASEKSLSACVGLGI